MVKLNSLQDLFMDGLKDAYSAEKQLIQALPKMAQAASNKDLQMAFEQHLTQTQRQKEQLDQIFEQLGSTPGRKKCVGMEGIISEGQELMAMGGSPDVMDAGLIASAQKAEHYEITAYGTLRTFARFLGNEQIAGTLQRILDEESKTDEKLTMLAESNINRHAVNAGAESRTKQR